MQDSLRELLNHGPARGLQESARLGLALLDLLGRKPDLRDPVELKIDDQGTLSLSGEPPPTGVGVYSSPDIESKPAAETSQVYVVAALLYHLLSGRAPFPDVGADALAVRKVLEPVAPLGSGVPTALSKAILGALSADATTRPTLAALKNALLDAGTPAPPRSAAPMSAAPMSAAPVMATGAALGRSPVPQDSAQRTRKIRRWPIFVAGAGALILLLGGLAALALLRTAHEPASESIAPAPASAPASAPDTGARTEGAPTPVSAPWGEGADLGQVEAQTEAKEEARAEADELAPGSATPEPSDKAPAPAAEAPARSGRAETSAPSAGGASPPKKAPKPSWRGTAEPAPAEPAPADAEPAPSASKPTSSDAFGSAPAEATRPPPANSAPAKSAPATTVEGDSATPSLAMLALVLIPVGLLMLVFGTGVTGVAVYYSTRSMRRASSPNSALASQGQPASGRSASTFPSLDAPPVLDPALDPPEPGFSPFMVGPFWCFGRVGEGGMGVVYKARHKALGRLSAVKALPPRLAQDARSLSWFRREAQLAARVQHPNVVAIFDYGELPGGLLYLAMEYVDGEPLSRRVRAGGLEASEVHALIAQIAAGLDAAHAAGIVHRDLKPDNVVVQPTAGRGFNAKILDFGIARPAESAGETRADLIVGTAAYMSPEQARGEPDLDARSDLFSLGVMAYELLTGRVPFVEPNMRTIQIVTRRGALDEAPPSVRSLRADLGPAVDRALAWGMAPRREDRPRTATALAEALGAALAR